MEVFQTLRYPESSPMTGNRALGDRSWTCPTAGRY